MFEKCEPMLLSALFWSSREPRHHTDSISSSRGPSAREETGTVSVRMPSSRDDTNSSVFHLHCADTRHIMRCDCRHSEEAAVTHLSVQ